MRNRDLERSKVWLECSELMTSPADRIVAAELRSSGRLWGFAFKDGSAQSLVEAGAPPADVDWVWQHFALSDNRSRLHIERWAGLPDAVRTFLLGAESRVLVNAAGDWCFGVLPDFEYALEGDATSACRLNFAFSGRDLITTRRHALHVVDALRPEIQT